MQTVLRRIRGALGMGAIWAFVWGAVGLVPRWVLGIEADAPFPLVFGVFGGVAGVIFSTILTLTAGRRRFDQLSLPRFAGVGAAGGTLLALFLTRMTGLGLREALLFVPGLTIVCAACASGSLVLARRAEAPALPVAPDADDALRPAREVHSLR
jgi:hypothetical protein